MKKNSEHIVTIESYSSTGAGIARVGGQVVFVKRALRGERCIIKLIKTGKNASYALVKEIITPSPHRLEPSCTAFGKCGGCDFLHMDYAEELNCKQQRVSDALTRIGKLDITPEPIVGADSRTGYRNKAIFAVGRVSDSAVTGFYRQHSHDIVPAGMCAIQADASNKAASAVCRWMDRYGIPHYDPVTKTGDIRHVFCRNAFSTGDLQVVIVTMSGRLSHKDALITEIRAAVPETVSIVQNINKTSGNTVLSGEMRTLYGTDFIEDSLCGLKFRLTPMSFYQINRAQAQKLYEKASELAGLTGDDTALDLYCGAGTITLLLAKSAGHVIGAELVQDAVECANTNAELNGITNAEFICSDASDAAKRLRDSGINPKAVVVDPPRKGLARDVIETIAAMTPERVVYISCDPATLARDLSVFAELCYTAESVTPFDMFPGCAHVECAALLVRSM